MFLKFYTDIKLIVYIKLHHLYSNCKYTKINIVYNVEYLYNTSV